MSKVGEDLQAVGMVVEYNPFHNGHRYALHQAKLLTKADVSVVVMSGNFTQRGEPAIIDKWARTRAALASGVDLVVELPLFYAVQPAHRFAGGALALLNALQVHQVAFGAEHPEWDFKALVRAEKQFNQADFNHYNATYATQFNYQLKAQTGVELKDPNDILAFAYTKAVVEHSYPITLHPIKRRGSAYHDQVIHGQIASASAIRKAVENHQEVATVLPTAMAQELTVLKGVPTWRALYPLLRNQLIQLPVKELGEVYQMAEGLEYRMKEMAQRARHFDEFIRLTKTKRYTYAHLLRMCLYTTMFLTEDEVSQHAQNPYLHILGFNQRGREYLHQIKKQVPLPMFTKVSQQMKDELCNLDYRAGKLYEFFSPIEQDVKHPPIIIWEILAKKINFWIPSLSRKKHWQALRGLV